MIACTPRQPDKSGRASPEAGADWKQAASWPPRIDEPYPKLVLMDGDGERVHLAQFKGKVLLIEPIGMTCPACQAFVGAHDRGSLGNVTPQKGLDWIETYISEYAGGIRLSDPRIVYIQLILYNMSMEAPSKDDVDNWSQHFGVERLSNSYVFGATPDMLGSASFAMIPGFQLVDTDFVLRSDSTGHSPRHDRRTASVKAGCSRRRGSNGRQDHRRHLRRYDCDY